MNRTLSEKKVLKKLNIPDFRHLSKEHVIKLATMIPHMDPEVAQKALEQFPNFASTSLEAMHDYVNIVNTAMKQNQEGSNCTHAMHKQIMNALEKMLDRDDITHDERMDIMTQMREVAKMDAELNAENRNFLLKMISICGGVILGGISLIALPLGGNLGIGNRTTSENEDEM